MKIPKDLEECFVFLDGVLVAEDKEVATNDSNFAVLVHHTLGRTLRNDWGLWGNSVLAKWFKEKGIEHADDMSEIILTSYHRYLNSKPIELEEQIKSCQEHWKEQEKVDNELTVVYFKEEVDEVIVRMCNTIIRGGIDNTVLIMILKGGVYTGMRMLEHLGPDIAYGFLGLNSYLGNNTESSGRVHCTYKPIFEDNFLVGKDVWLVDDVIQSCFTWIHAEKIIKQYGPKSIRLCALVDKTKAGLLTSLVSGFTYNGGKFIVGCGMGVGEKYRNLQNICEYED